MRTTVNIHKTYSITLSFNKEQFDKFISELDDAICEGYMSGDGAVLYNVCQDILSGDYD